ncbi:sigma factor G inhibitor Gin [Halobacillus salinarum]|uniref:Sigma factor G inhibitor Gin n=1 Tax=Halobacillus salinarum TaxID=2932257 RepID=A0ABY4ERE6_9BACI|nr:sigma factor G inhibitor Gin [Halobacillus salinarum]UOQ44696.1 sigma factor G inhibitor Gin [Halobacillus salinarum]
MNRKECCSICSREAEDGIYLLKLYICQDCEREMIDTPTSDPKYDFFVKQMKKAQRAMIPS